MKKTLLLLAINAAIFTAAQAQEALPPSPPQTGGFIEKTSTGIVRYKVANTDTTGQSGFYAVLGQDTFRIRLTNDTTYIETTNYLKFTPSLAGGGECCVPDSAFLNYLTTQCTTITNSRNQVLLLDSNGQATTTACQRIQYLEVDTLVVENITSIKGTPNEIIYFGADSLITSDEEFYRTDSNTIIVSGNYGLLIGKNDFLPVTEGAGVIYPSSSTVCFNGINNENGLYTAKIITLSEALTVHTLEADTERVTIYAKTDISEPVPVAGIVVAEVDSSISFEFSNQRYYFPKTTGSNGYSLTSDGNSPSQLYWKNTPDVTSGTGVPATTPAKVGDIYVDTSGKKIYFATGTTNSSDWTITN